MFSVLTERRPIRWKFHILYSYREYTIHCKSLWCKIMLKKKDSVGLFVYKNLLHEKCYLRYMYIIWNHQIASYNNIYHWLQNNTYDASEMLEITCSLATYFLAWVWMLYIVLIVLLVEQGDGQCVWVCACVCCGYSSRRLMVCIPLFHYACSDVYQWQRSWGGGAWL